MGDFEAVCCKIGASSRPFTIKFCDPRNVQAPQKIGELKAPGIPLIMFVSKTLRICMRVHEETKVEAVMHQANKELKEFDGWDKEHYITEVSAPWLVQDDCEFELSDKMKDLDGWADKMDKSKLYFLGCNHEHFDMHSFDDV